MDNESFLQSVDRNFDRATGLLGLSDDLAGNEPGTFLLGPRHLGLAAS